MHSMHCVQHHLDVRLSTVTDEKRIALGPAAQQIAKNLNRIRGKMTFAELSNRLAEVGRPIPVLGLRRIEQGERRVDVDDLVALAKALRVHPIQLVYPVGFEESIEILPGHSVDVWAAAKYFTGEAPFPAALGQIRDVTVADDEAPARLPLELYRLHDRRLGDWSRAKLQASVATMQPVQPEGPEQAQLRQQALDAAERAARVAEEALDDLRRQMRRHGISPPAIFDIRLSHIDGGEE
jgi:hypothetical protein